MHITSFLAGVGGVDQFISTAASLGFFAEVMPVRSGTGRLLAVAFFSKDLDGISDELEMPEIAEKLSGILDRDICIASAWQFPSRDGSPREHAWLVRGRDRAVPGEVIRERPALT
jgi:hypothetical protein